MDDKLLTKKEVKSIVGYSYQHTARLEAQKRFPLRIKPSGIMGKAFYLESEIRNWVSQQVATRDRSE